MLVVGSQNININATKATAQNRYVKNVSIFFCISLGVLLAGRPALVNDYLIITRSLRLNFSSCILTAMYFCALKSYRTAIVLHPLAAL